LPPAASPQASSFVFGSIPQCSPREIVTVNRQGQELLTLFQELVDGVGGIAGLDGPSEVTPSPDGLQLYVAAGGDQSLTVLARDEESGELTWSGSESGVFTDELGPPAGVRVSPDGEFLYVASLPETGQSSGIAVFSRSPATGEPTFVDRVLDDVDNLVISPDGRHLYAAGDDEVSVYSRNEASGLLTYFESIAPGGELAISPDGRHLYATRGSITLYGRDESSGQLTFLGTGPSLSAGMTAISPEGRHLYSVAGGPSELVVQERSEATGALSPIATIEFTAGLGSSGGSVAVSPDGSFVVAGGNVGMTVFRRDPVSGALAFVDNYFNGDLPVDALAGPRSLAFGPGGEHLYAVGVDDALLAFRTLPAEIFEDGFESGSTSAWSSVVP
jgi:6-phosphogluconolactonase (cycloisomerase 2 family)